MVQAECNVELVRTLLRRSPLTLEERQGVGFDSISRCYPYPLPIPKGERQEWGLKETLTLRFAKGEEKHRIAETWYVVNCCINPCELVILGRKAPSFSEERNYQFQEQSQN